MSKRYSYILLVIVLVMSFFSVTFAQDCDLDTAAAFQNVQMGIPKMKTMKQQFLI